MTRLRPLLGIVGLLSPVIIYLVHVVTR